MQPQLFQQEAGDGLDLVGGAPVEGGEGDAVGDRRRELEVAELSQVTGELSPELFEEARPAPGDSG